MKSTSDLFSKMIPLGRLIQMVNQKKDRLLNDYLSPMDIAAARFRVSYSIHCEVCIIPAESEVMSSVSPGVMTRMLGHLVCEDWIERLLNPADKRGVLVQLTPDGAALRKQCHQVVGQKLYQGLTKGLSADGVVALEQLLKKILL